MGSQRGASSTLAVVQRLPHAFKLISAPCSIPSPACVVSLCIRYSAHELSDPYTAGAAIRWLKALGPWSDADVEERLLPCYPKVMRALQQS
jgi:hypothetical protein